jgi:hypothetical protein
MIDNNEATSFCFQNVNLTDLTIDLQGYFVITGIEVKSDVSFQFDGLYLCQASDFDYESDYYLSTPSSNQRINITSPNTYRYVYFENFPFNYSGTVCIKEIKIYGKQFNVSNSNAFASPQGSDLMLYTGNDQRLTIKSSTGNVLIGKTNQTNAAYKLDIAGIVNATSFVGDGSLLTGIKSSQWTTSGSNIYFNTGNVGIGGLAISSKKLYVNGGFKIDGNIEIGNPYDIAGGIGVSVSQAGYTICNNGTIRGLITYSPTSGVFSVGQSTYDVDRLNFLNSNIGIGTINPTEKLEVTGNIKATKFIGDGSGLTNLPASQWTATGSDIYYNSGNVGIGALPSNGYKLYVNGNLKFDGILELKTQFTLGNPDYIGGFGIIVNARYISISDNNIQKGFMGFIPEYDLFSIGNYTTMLYFKNSNIGIGTKAPAYKLDVIGTIRAQEVKVNLDGQAADFVFYPDYKLKNLSDVEAFIKTYSHLPEIPSALEIEKNGLSLGEMQNKLLQKVEELTLYAIEQQKIINEQTKTNKILLDKLSEQEANYQLLLKMIKELKKE